MATTTPTEQRYLIPLDEVELDIVLDALHRQADAGVTAPMRADADRVHSDLCAHKRRADGTHGPVRGSDHLELPYRRGDYPWPDNTGDIPEWGF